MKIYYNNITFTKIADILVLHDNGNKEVFPINNNEKEVLKLIYSLLDDYPKCRVTIYIKNEKLLSVDFLDMMYDNGRITVKRM